MTRTLPLATLVVAAALLTDACGYSHSTNVLTPTTPTPTTGGTSSPASTPSIVGGWVSTTAAAPTPNSCGNFQYQIASQTATAIAGTFTATCGNIVVSASANGTLNGTNVTVRIDGSGSGGGLQTCQFSVTGNGTIEDNGNTLRIPYAGTTCLGPVQGTEVLRRPQAAAAPSPAPAPAPAPTPAPPPAPSGPVDGIDLHQATITGMSPTDVADWPITTKIDGLDFGNGVRVDFSKKDGPGRWPDVVPPGWDGGIQYTLWMVANVNGQWYTSGGVEYWYGLDRQGGPASQIAYNWYYSPGIWGPLANHQPANGELVGFFVTAGDERVKSVYSVRERSNVVTLGFPTGGGYFTFGFRRTR